MYSTFTTNADDALDSPYLFEQTHDGLLSMSMAHENAHLKAPSPSAVPISGLDGLTYGQYSDSTPSSIHFVDTHDLSEPSGGHLSGREERDGSTSSGYMNGHEHSHAPSPLYYPHPLQNYRSHGLTNGASYNPSAKSNGGNSLSRTVTGTTTSGITAVQYPSKLTLINNNPMARTLSRDSKPSSTPELSQSQEPSSAIRSISSVSAKGKANEYRASSSIPQEMSWEEFARQTILAAESSRLNPFALHPEEYKLLRKHITHAQVTIYLNIRNAILRLWTRNPLVKVTMEEAAGCARDKRYFGLANVAYHWLMRNGYINFGCVEVSQIASTIPRLQAKGGPQRTILVIGAGMSGLGCARHLEGLFAQVGDQYAAVGERPPRVIVLEARPRVGGRVYSHQFRNQKGSTLPAGYRCTAEMGAQIITGFEHGNPLDAIIRGQLGIPYHGLRDNTILYDHDGTIVETSQDLLVERLYNDVLERASTYRNKPAMFRTVEGDRNLILFGRDPSDTGGASIATLENSNTPLPANAQTTASTTEEKPSTGVEKLAGRSYQLTAGFNPNISAAEAAKSMGWKLRPGVLSTKSVDLDTTAKSSDYPTLGQAMDDGIQQYQDLLELTTRDLRLLNWHHANLEYANAVSVSQLSLSGWDQDIGNEFSGEHSQIIGGYQQVPRGLWQLPDKLDVRFNAVVKAIHYDTEERRIGKAVKVDCHNGETFAADQIVITTPLGVLKAGAINFQPPLPDWKQGVIERMGFGLLNKIILVYEKAFWESHRDMFGLLNEAEHRASLDPKEYASRRGRFYLFWNCIKTSGKPTLVALMAGDAAHYAEATPDNNLIKDVTERLKKMFAPKIVPPPSETIITRWSKDPFARGSYSYVGPKTQAGDYDVMARPHGPLHFAGEATCGTHPATVHGAYLSGLRVAAEVLETMTGPINIPSPLVEKKIKVEHPMPSPSLDPKRKTGPQTTSSDTKEARLLRDEDYEAQIIGAILTALGERPLKPGRSGVNPFLLYTKDKWSICKQECDDARKAATGDVNAKASRNDIRIAIGLSWRTARTEVKQPYLDLTENARETANTNAANFKEVVATWDREAARIRMEYIQSHPPPGGNEDLILNSRTAIELGAGKRLRRI